MTYSTRIQTVSHCVVKISKYFLGKYGQLTYVRVYQGTVAIKDDMINTRTGKRTQVKRLVQMHSDKMEDIKEVSNFINKTHIIGSASRPKKKNFRYHLSTMGISGSEKRINKEG